MINTIRKFFKSNENSKSDNLEGNQDELAYASLLIEVIKSDDHFDQREHDELLNILGTKLSIDEKALGELSELAQKNLMNQPLFMSSHVKSMISINMKRKFN